MRGNHTSGGHATDPDAIILIPRFDKHHLAAAPAKSRVHQVMDTLKKGRHSLMNRAARFARKTVVRSLFRAGGSSTGMLIRGAARGGPIGLLILGAAVAAVYATRVGTGRTFENLGEQVNELILGDSDEMAAATGDIRKQLMNDNAVMHMLSDAAKTDEHGNVTLPEDFLKAANQLRDERYKQLRGESMIRQDPFFQVDDTLGMLIMRMHEYLVASLKSMGVTEQFDQFTSWIRGWRKIMSGSKTFSPW